MTIIGGSLASGNKPHPRLIGSGLSALGILMSGFAAIALLS